jgi:predicted nucleic acid-binding protein
MSPPKSFPLYSPATLAATVLTHLLHSPRAANQRIDAGCAVVLDTNAVLDWLVFANPAGLSIGRAVGSGLLWWVATEAMRAEFAYVVTRGFRRAPAHDAAQVLSQWDRWAHLVDAAPAGGPGLRCRDAGDQPFIDLAARRRIAYLISRDRAVLQMRKRLAVYGVRVLTQDALAAQLESLPGTPDRREGAAQPHTNETGQPAGRPDFVTG